MFRHGMAACRTRAQLARQAGLGERCALALDNLLAERELTAAQLGRRLRLGAAETAAIVEGLEQDGFICRRAPAAAGGAVVLAPTPLGRTALAASVAVVPEALDAAAGAVIAAFLDRLTEATERETERLERGAELRRDG